MVGQGWHSGGGEGKRDGNICESTNNESKLKWSRQAVLARH